MTNCKPAYQNGGNRILDPEGMLAAYMAGDAVMVRRGEDPGRFSIQSVIPGGGTDFLLCGPDELTDMVRYSLRRPDRPGGEVVGEGKEQEGRNAIEAAGVMRPHGALRVRPENEPIDRAAFWERIRIEDARICERLGHKWYDEHRVGDRECTRCYITDPTGVAP